MDIYSVVICILTAFSFSELFENENKIQKRKKFLIIILVIGLMLISAFRDSTVGKDLLNYLSRYYVFGTSSWQDLFQTADYYSFEYGFAVLCKLLYLINPNPSFFIVVSSIIVSVGFYNLSKLSYMPITTLFIIVCFGFYGSSMNIVRQFIAFSILTFSINYVFEKNLIKFLIIVGIATLIHSMSFLFIPIYFLYARKFSNISFIIIFILMVTLSLFGQQLVSIVAGNSSFAWYLSKSGTGSGESTLIFLISILICMYSYRKIYLELNEKNNLYIWIISLAILFNVVALSMGIFARVMYFFTPFISVMIPNLLFSLKKQEKFSLIIFLDLLIIIFFTLYYYIIMMGGEAESARWFPYHSRLIS